VVVQGMVHHFEGALKRLVQGRSVRDLTQEATD